MFDGLIKQKAYDPDQIAEYLQANPERIKEFEDGYRSRAIDWKSDEHNLFEYNSREANEKSGVLTAALPDEETAALHDLKAQIVRELVSYTGYCFRIHGKTMRKGLLPPRQELPVKKEDLMALPEALRPMCTSELIIKDVHAPSGLILLQEWISYKREKDPKKKEMWYHHFRQGLDLMDLDELMYSMLDQNPNAMSHWLPQIAVANAEKGFFRIPETTIVKVPLPILQLTRLSYESINQTTKDIVNEWARTVFQLDKDRHYFIKTGTFSSKFDFRNARVAEEKEVMEIGEYLLFIQYQAQQMAASLSSHVIYGASTTNEWVVREFIEDVENNPTIYKGLPLHTEYRVFVDFDEHRILGISPYWEPELMKKRFAEGMKTSPHDLHDYIVYKAHEPVLMARYIKNKEKVLEGIKGLLNADLIGQWSIDIMQNGEDFWLIDMATADTSALNSCIDGPVKRFDVDWAAGARTVLAGEKCRHIQSD